MGPTLGIIQDVQAASEMEGQRMARLGSSPPSGRLAQILPARHRQIPNSVGENWLSEPHCCPLPLLALREIEAACLGEVKHSPLSAWLLPLSSPQHHLKTNLVGFFFFFFFFLILFQNSCYSK